MNLKRFISGVSAFAVAVTAFAAVAVTANAKDYGPTDYTAQANKTTVNKSNWDKNGIFTAKAFESGEYAGAYLNFSALPDISKATSVTLEFDTFVYNNTITLYGFGDASQRIKQLDQLANNEGTYNETGLAMFFGSNDGTIYEAKDIQSGTNELIKLSDDPVVYPIKKLVHASVTLDRKQRKYSVTLKEAQNVIFSRADALTGIGNLTYVNAYTNKSGGQFGLKNITVKYTVEVPTVSIPSEVEVDDKVGQENVYARAFTTEITYNGIAIENVKVEVVGSNEKPQILPLNSVTSGNVSIGIIIASKDEDSINNFNVGDLKITPNVTNVTVE